MYPEFSYRTFRLIDVPKKRQYLLERLRKVYPQSEDKFLIKILDLIKIKFREQEERGASNYHKKEVYVPFYDLEKFSLFSLTDILEYLESPKSVITHEVIHIFQNLSRSFPNIKYFKDEDKKEIDYKKYLNDPGEKQSRYEQVKELLKWGFSKKEIIEFLRNKKNDDRKIWENLIDLVIKQTNKGEEL